MPPGGFDETVCVLKFLVTRLIANQCRAAPNPMGALLEWSSAVDAEKQQIEEFMYRSDTSADVTVNAVLALAEFDHVMSDISAAVQSRK
jgi:hypothetical protein